MWFDGAHVLGEAEHIVGVCDELALCGQVAVVANVEDAVCFSIRLHLTKVKSFGAKLYVVTFGLTAALEG